MRLGSCASDNTDATRAQKSVVVDTGRFFVDMTRAGQGPVRLNSHNKDGVCTYDFLFRR